MSKKGKLDVSFIKQVIGLPEWTNTVLKNSDQLLVVEVYAAAWGPSDMLDAHFSTVYYELADKLAFGFVRAVADAAPALKDYKGSPCSTFLFYMDGKEVAKITGPKMSEIKTKILELAPKL